MNARQDAAVAPLEFACPGEMRPRRTLAFGFELAQRDVDVLRRRRGVRPAAEVVRGPEHSIQPRSTATASSARWPLFGCDPEGISAAG